MVCIKLLMLCVLATQTLPSLCQTQRKNVLFVISDDLRPEVSPYAGTDNEIFAGMQTPSLDALSADGVTFTSTYSNYPQCCPSRASFLTGRRPETTRVYDNHYYWREEGGNFTSLPQFFKENGYYSQGIGKVYHGNSDSGGDDLDYSWTDYWDAPNQSDWNGDECSWVSVDTDTLDEPLPDVYLKDYAIEKLHEFAPAAISGEQPFFMAIGFRKPHMPFIAPHEFFDMYDLDNISLPRNPWVLEDFPEIAWRECNEVKNKGDIEELNVTLEFNTTTPDFKTLELRRGYYAGVSYTDYLFGEVMVALEDLGLKNNTVVMFIGDHGWQLGEHALWCKVLSFDLVARAPMILSTPDMTDEDRGLFLDSFVELVDIYPTLVKAAGLGELDLCPSNSSEIAVCREGEDLMKLVDAPDNWQRDAAFYQHIRDPYGTIMGLSIRTVQYRYTKWVDFDFDANYALWDQVHGEELYDLTVDPDENYNMAHKQDYAQIRDEMEQRLRDGWREELP